MAGHDFLSWVEEGDCYGGVSHADYLTKVTKLGKLADFYQLKMKKTVSLHCVQGTVQRIDCHIIKFESVVRQTRTTEPLKASSSSSSTQH